MAGGVPHILSMLGILTIAGGALAAVLVLAEAPFNGPWRVVLAVAAVYAGIYAGFLVIGFAANLRLLRALLRAVGRAPEAPRS